MAMMLIRLDRFLARVRGGAACIVLCTRVSAVHIYTTYDSRLLIDNTGYAIQVCKVYLFY